jgi:hypothetical protein
MQSPNVTKTELRENDSARLVNKRALARILSVSVRTIDNFVRQRKIPAVRISNRCIRFDPLRVLAALRRFELKEAK